MAVNIPTSKPKTILYKMVTVPKVKVTPQNSATVTSYKAFTTGLNRLGATINSMIVLQQRTNNALTESLKLKAKQAEDDKRQQERDRLRDKKGTGLGKLATNTVKAAAFVVADFFESILGLFQTILQVVVTQSILRWLANPANREKLTVVWNALVSFFKFLWDFISTNISKTLSGLSDMLNSNLGFWDRLKGFGTFLVGFGSLLLGFAFLKKPKLLLDGVKFVLKTVWDSVTGLIKILRGRKSKTPTGAAAPGKTSGGRTPADATGGGPRGRGGALLKGLGAVSMIAAPLVIGGMLGGGESEFEKSVTGDTSGGQPGPEAFSSTPQLAEGGIVTRPTQALIGERGPEARIPLLSKAQNAKNMSAAGISPLPGGGLDRKKAKNLSDLYMAPFKGIGAGILANISNVVGQIPGAGATTEVLNNIVAPIANSFGVPSSLVKKLTGKKESTGDKRKGGISLGKGITSNQGEKFQRKGDNSVLGLLSDLVGAGQVLNNKLNKKKGTGTGTGGDPLPDTTPGKGTKADSADSSSSSAVEAAQQGKGSQDLSKGVVGASQATQQGQSSENRQNFDSSNAKANRHNLPFKGPDGVTNYEAKLNVTNGDYEVWKHNGILGWQRLDISKDKNTLQKQKAFNQVRAFYIKHAQQQGLNLNYITQDDVKRRQELIKKYDAEKKSKGVDGSAGYKNKPPKKAEGGWIQGPMSGYPVSLDGGGSTSFIGHGTEWVGFKKAMGGKSGTDAFVIPYDTPATQNNHGLTNSRFKQAKSGGYALPTFSVGGELKKQLKFEEKIGGDGRPMSKFAAGGKAILEGAKKIVGYGRGSGDQCANSTRAALRAAGHPAAGKTTSKGDLDNPKGSSYSKGLGFAASFAGTDMGAVIQSPGALEPGDIVLWQGGNGYKPGEITHVGIKGEGNDLWHHGRAAGFRKASMYTSYGGQKFKAGIRLGGEGTVTSSTGNASTDSTGSTGSTGGEAGEGDPLKLMADSIDKLNAMMGLVPTAPTVPQEVWVNKKTGEISITDPAKLPGKNAKDFEKKAVSKLTDKEKKELDKILKSQQAQVSATGTQATPGQSPTGGAQPAAVGASPAASTSAVAQATTAADAEKDRLKTASKQAAAAAGAAAVQQAAATSATTGSAVAQVPSSQPIILPSKPSGIPVAYLFPKTGMLTNTTALAFGQ